MSPPSPRMLLSNITVVLVVISVFAVSFLHMTVAVGLDPLLLKLPLDGRDADHDDRDGDDLIRLGSRKTLSVTDYGAVGNGISDDTRAFTNAWHAACSSTSEKTTLKIPEDHKYSVRPMSFSGPCTSNVTFRIMGSIVPHRSFFSAFWHSHSPRRWLYFQGLSNVALRGRGVGTINALGNKWWMKTCKCRSRKPCQPSTVAVAFHNCRFVKVRNMTLLDSPGPHLVFTNSYHVKVSGVRIRAPADHSPHNGGIEIVGTRTVYIQNSRIATGDDCISVGAGSSKVRVRGVACVSGHGISIGSLGKSNSWAKVNDVQVDGAMLSNVKNGLWIKTWQGGQGFAEEISFQNVRMDNVANPIIIDQYYCDNYLLPTTCGNKTHAVRVSRVSFANIVGTSATERAITFSCSDALPCHSILLRDIRLSLVTNTTSTTNATSTSSYCWKASGFSYGLVDPPSCLATGQDDYPIMQKVPFSTALLSSAK